MLPINVVSVMQSDVMTNKLRSGSEGFHLPESSAILTLLTIKKDYEKWYRCSQFELFDGNYFRVLLLSR